jgi:hypothetical protein
METYINPITVCSTLSREGNVPVLFWMVMARRWVGYVVGPFSSLLTGGTSRCKLSYECIVSGSSSYVHASAPSAAVPAGSTHHTQPPSTPNWLVSTEKHRLLRPLSARTSCTLRTFAFVVRAPRPACIGWLRA